MNAVLNELPRVVEEALALYDLDTVSACTPVTHGIENANYFVTTSRNGTDRHFVLTFLQQDSYAGQSYVPMLKRLKEAGLPVPAPLQNSQGEPITILGTERILLQPRLTGLHTINPTLRQISALARFTARMHLTLKPLSDELPSYPRSAAWLRKSSDQIASRLSYTGRRLLFESIDRTEMLFSRGDVQRLPVGGIHGDLFRDNVLFNEHGLTGALDFHHASLGFWIYDLAVIANDWCNDTSGRLDPDRVSVLLRAYHQIRPLCEEEIWFFSTFALYAGVAFWVSRMLAVEASRHQPGIRTKDPEEFRRIVAHHHARSYYMDTRSLRI